MFRVVGNDNGVVVKNAKVFGPFISLPSIERLSHKMFLPDCERTPVSNRGQCLSVWVYHEGVVLDKFGQARANDATNGCDIKHTSNRKLH